MLSLRVDSSRYQVLWSDAEGPAVGSIHAHTHIHVHTYKHTYIHSANSSIPVSWSSLNVEHNVDTSRNTCVMIQLYGF